MNPPTTRPKRPFGVYAIIVLQLLRALSVSFVVLPFVQDLPSTIAKNLQNQNAFIVAISLIIAGNLVVCIGLFLLKRWAWIAIMILIGSNLLFSLWLYWNGTAPFIDMLIDVVSVFYLNLRNVQAAFEPRSATPEAAT